MFGRGRIAFATPLGLFHVDVEVARTLAERAQGLADRERLDGGMLFVFPVAVPVAFTTLGMRLDLDIVFVDADGVVRRVARGRAGQTVPVYSPGAVRWVVELPDGTADRQGIVPGTRLYIE